MRIWILIIFTLFNLKVSAINTFEAIAKSNELIKVKKYESAYKILLKADPNNLDKDILIKKQEILFKYGISTDLHQAFFLKNVKSDSELNNGQYDIKKFKKYSFYPVPYYDSLLKLDPNNCLINKALGEYYFDAYEKYRGRWIINDSELIQLIAQFNENATNKGCGEAKNYYALGQVLIAKNKLKESIYFFNNAVTRNEKEPRYQYFLAYAYLFNKGNEKAIEHGKNSINLFSDIAAKSDASRLVGQAYLELNNYEEALSFFKKADSIDSSTNANKLSILSLYVKKKDSVNQAFYLNELFEKENSNINFYGSLESIYTLYSSVDFLTSFYETKLGKTANNDTLNGNLYFFTARLYSINNPIKSIEYFEKSKTYFEKIYKNDHEVFGIINKSIESLKAVKND